MPTDQALLLSTAADASREPPQLLALLAAPTRQAVLEMAVRRKFEPGRPLFRQGAPHDGIHLIDSGLVRSSYLSEGARELTLGYWTAGHYVGAPQVFGGGSHAWTSRAVEATQTLWLPGTQLRELATCKPDLALALLDLLEHKAHCYCAVLQLLATNSMRVRLARLLGMLNAREVLQLERGSECGVLALSHAELASMIGSTRQWVSLTLARFEREGLVERIDTRKLRVRQPAQLAAVR